VPDAIRQPDAHHRSTAGGDRRRPTVRLRDRTHDGKSQAGAAAGARLVPAGEAFKGPRGDVGPEARPLVRYLQGDAPGRLPRAEHDLAFTVAKCVVDEVSNGLAHAQWVGAQLQVVASVDADATAPLLGAVHQRRTDALEQRTNAERLASYRQLTLRRAGDDQ